MRKPYGYFLVLCISFATAETINIKNGLIEAIKKSPELQEQYYLHKEVTKDKALSKAGWFPSFAFIAEHEYTKIDNGSFANQTTDSSAVEIKQNLFKGFADINKYELESARVHSASFKVSLERNKRALEFIENYINVLKNRDFLEISKMSLDNRTKVYAKIKKKVDVGLGRQLEQRHAKSSLDLSRLTFRVQQRNSSQEVIKFSKLLNRKIHGKDLEKIEQSFCMPKDFNALYEVVKIHNPSLKISKINIDVVQQEYEASQAGYWPTLDFTADYYLSNSISNTNQSNNYEFGITLNYNIFNGLADRNKQEKQQSRLKQKSAVLRKTQRDLKNRVQLAWFSYELNQDKYSFSQINVRSKREALSSYDYEFLLGRASLNAMLNATEDYYNALKEMTASYYDLITDYYRIMETTGLLYEIVTKQINLPFTCSASDTLDVKLVIKEIKPKEVKSLKTKQQCYKVLKEKISIYDKTTVKSEKRGFLIKDTLFCSEIRIGQWIKIEKGWVEENGFKAISIQY